MNMTNPRKLTEDEVRLLMVQMAGTMPPEITLADMVPELIRLTAAVSDRLSMQESGALLGVATALARACAAGDPAATRHVKVARRDSEQ